MSTEITAEIPDLSMYLEVARRKYDACLSRIDEPIPIDGMDALVRFKHIKFDTDGQPKFKELAKCLADHITNYCFSAQRRQRAQTEEDLGRLHKAAKKLIRQDPKSGEAGEILLYFLMEAVLQAPQMVAKMNLKTSAQMEIHGSDGIHMRWDKSDGCLDIYFGEAKLHEDISSSLTKAFNSIDEFHKKNQAEHELELVTSHYKWADDRTKEIVLQHIDRQEPLENCRFNHACLIGYDWKEYQKLNGEERNAFLQDFVKIYREDIPRLLEFLKRRFEKFDFSRLRFEVFFLPFRSVQEFRDAFKDAL